MSDKRVDEDWKKRVQQEKELDAAKAGEGAPKEKAPPRRGGRGRGGPSAFSGLVESLGAQALMFMGAMRDPLSGQTHQDLGQAQAMIDLLEMLEEKTKGNLTKEEEDHITKLLNDIRLAFVQMASPPPPPPQEGGAPPPPA